MEDTYGYKPLSWELIELLTSGPPDFAAAEELIRRGADVNDQGDDKSRNVLSELLEGYWSSYLDGAQIEYGKDEDEITGPLYSNFRLDVPGLGPSMIAIIRFFLDHGFDVHRGEGQYGASCLNAVVFSFCDAMIEATKILLDAGAQNVPVYDDDPDSTPKEAAFEEQCFQIAPVCNHDLANIYEAVCQIYSALEEGRPYAGIDCFRTAIGKRITGVLAAADPGTEVFYTAETDRYHYDNCFHCDLYFMFDGGFLICERDVSYYVDTVLPEKPLIDVSDHFPDVVGCTIDDITFRHRDIEKGIMHWGQPIDIFHLSNGKKLIFTINFGEEDGDNYCTYYFYL